MQGWINLYVKNHKVEWLSLPWPHYVQSRSNELPPPNNFLFEHAIVKWKITPIGANFTYVKNNSIPLTIDFSDFSNSDPVSWRWNFPGGDQITTENCTYTFATPGLHTVKLEAWTSGGAKFIAEKDIPITVGIDDVVSNYSLFMGPNPTNGELNIDLKLFSNQNITVAITNILGQEIIVDNKSNVSQYNKTFDLSEFPDGIYMIKFSNANFSISKKILLSK